MNKQTKRGLIGGLGVVVVVGLIWMVTHRGSPTVTGTDSGTGWTTSAIPATVAGPPRAKFPPSPPTVVEPKPYRPEAQLAKANSAWAGDQEKMRAEVRTVLKELKDLYGFVGELPLDEARQLLAQRRAVEAALLQRLATLGPGGARVMQESFNPASEARAQLLMARALGLIDDPEASAVMGELLAGGGSFSLRKELVASLGLRFDDAGATQVLSKKLAEDADAQMRYAAAQALSGRAGAVETLVERIQQDADKTVRLEAMRAVGLTGSEAGQAALLAVAQDSGQELIVRQTAIQELRRSYGTKAWDELQGLRESPDAAIRTSAEKALTMLMGSPGKTVLNTTARP